MKYRIVKRIHEDKSIGVEYVVQGLDRHDDWYSYWTCRTLEKAEEYVKELMGEGKEKYVETVVKEYQQTGSIEYFFSALYERETLFGEEFEIFQQTRNNVGVDIMFSNGGSVCIVNVTRKADTDDVRKIPSIKDKFRQNYPEHADKKLFLALASMSFDEYVENECKKLGIAIIKQVGDTIAIYDEHLKVF